MKNKHFIPAYIFGALIIISSFLPTQRLEKVQDSHVFFKKVLSDYSLHFFAFGIFAALLCYGFRKTRNRAFSFFWISFISLTFGLVVELYQILIPYRAFNPYDLIFNVAGIIVVLILFKIFLNFRKIQNVIRKK